MRTATLSPGATAADSLTNGLDAKFSTIDAVTAGGGESTIVDVVVVDAVFVTTVVDVVVVATVTAVVVVELEELDDDDELDVAAIVVDELDDELDELEELDEDDGGSVVVVVDTPTLMAESSGTAMIRWPSASMAIAVHVEAPASETDHVDPPSEDCHIDAP